MFGSFARPLYGRILGVTAAGTASYFGWELWGTRRVQCEALEVDTAKIPRPSRIINGVNSVKQDFHVTLFQYQTCPFCSKVRAFMDYYGLAYDVIEVNPLFRTEVKWSEYKKIPFVLYNDKRDNRKRELLLPDSSLIISLLRTIMMESSTDSESVRQVLQYYPKMPSADNGKSKEDFANKYQIMFGHDLGKAQKAAASLETKWRKWVDDELVHTLAPNIYQSPGEAIRTFKYLAEAGEWNRIFPAWQVPLVIYIGAGTMYVIGKRLKKRYKLSDDVRISLYAACDEWVRAVGSKNFLGGDQPNLADLAAYGVLSAIEGCDAFADLTAHTKILPWYQRTKQLVLSHDGSRLNKSVIASA